MRKTTTQNLALIGVMSAAVYVASAFLQIRVPTAIGTTRLHMGNVMCLLSGMILGATPGGLAAGIGSVFFDLTNPVEIASAPFTFVFKFVMAWLCGKIISNYSTASKSRFIVGATVGALTYVTCYLSKSFIENRFVFGFPLEIAALTTAQRAIVSSINAVIAVIVAVYLGIVLRPALTKLLAKIGRVQ